METNGILDVKTDTELATPPPPVSDREQEEQFSDVTMPTESLAEKPEDGDAVNQMETTCSHKPEETNGREEFISPPLADSDDDDDDKMEESEVAQEISATDNSVQKSEETNTLTIDDDELHIAIRF